MLIYVVPGVTGIIQNKSSGSEKKETFRIDAYFALTRSTHDLTIIYVNDLDIEKLPEAPVKPMQFMEDLSEDQLAVALDLPVGLKNLL